MSADRLPHVPDLLLEQYRLNELPPEEADRLERRLATDQALRARIEALQRSDEEIGMQYPPEWLAQRIRARLPAPPRRAASGVRQLAFASALATVVLMMLVPLLTNTEAPDAGADRVKGLTPTLMVYRRTPEGSETLADGAVARAGDLLRLGYVSAGRAHGLILSIDGHGIVTRHLPLSGPRAAALGAGGIVLLDEAYELDDAPAWERFYFVTAEGPFDVAPVIEAARRAAAASGRRPPDILPIPREFDQSTFSLQKEVTP
jgi:anti-sigma factor RsiW